jgi:hypothetical protein
MYIRLIAGRDFQNSLCGVSGQKTRDGVDLEPIQRLYYTMNLTGVVEDIAGAGLNKSSIVPLPTIQSELSTLLSPSSLLLHLGSNIFSSLDEYFIPVCVSSCDFNSSTSPMREFVWSGSASIPGWLSYSTVAAVSNPSLLDPFTFSALPFDICPYSPEFCVPLQDAPFEEVMDRYCVPSVVVDGVGKQIPNLNLNFFNDLKLSWKLIVIIFFSSIGISLVFLGILRLSIGIFVWFLVLASLLLLAGIGVTLLLYSYKCLGDPLLPTGGVSALKQSVMGEVSCAAGYSINDPNYRQLTLIFSFIFFLFFLVYFFIILIFRKRIKLAINLNKISIHFIFHNLSCLLIPFVQLTFLGAWWVGWLADAVFTLSSPPVGDEMNQRFNFSWQFGFELFSFFWVNSFILSVGQMAVAGMVGLWYFTPNNEKKGLGFRPLRSGLVNTFFFHLGTVAFGCLILSIIKLIKLLTLYAYKMARKNPTTSGLAQNRAVSCLFTCVYSCIACVEKLFTALSETAFIFSSLFGTNFLKSANLSIKFIFLNFSKISALHLVTNLISLIGVGFIFASTVALGWGLVGEYYPEISSPLYILILFCFFGFFISKIFLSILEISSESIFICFVADEELNNGSGEFTPPALEKLIKRGNPPVEEPKEAVINTV